MNAIQIQLNRNDFNIVCRFRFSFWQPTSARVFSFDALLRSGRSLLFFSARAKTAHVATVTTALCVDLFISIRYQLMTVGGRRQIGSAIKSLQQNLFRSHTSRHIVTCDVYRTYFHSQFSFRLEKLFSRKAREKV